MKIQCPNCKKITELEHVDHGSQVECVCSFVFTVDESTITEEFTEVDSSLPEQIGQYKVTGFIGFGGMGKIYLAEHPNLGIPVAIKSLRMEYMTDRASCERFVQSAKICAKINHPNIVRIYDCGYEDEKVFLVMEYITKGSALNLLEQEGKLDPEYAAFIMLEVCSGLMEAEKYGIVHRDIKPENIMFDDEGTVKILDLGLSKIIGDNRIGKQNITVSLTALGTPLYMAPEQAVDASNCDSRADIYSIGVSLYQLCTGKLPFDSDDPHELRRMHALEKPVPPRQLVPELRPDMEKIILRCMEKKREDRYASITDLALDLEAYLKNRVLPSTIRQTPPENRQLPVGRGSLRRRILYWWKAYSRRVSPPVRWLISGGIAALIAAAGVIVVMIPAWKDAPVRKATRSTPVSVEKILAGLSRQAAVYLPDQDYDAVIGLYRNYQGPLAAETAGVRSRIADGYQLTRRQTAAALRGSLSESILRGHYSQAWDLYLEQNGPKLCPECRELLQQLVAIPGRFKSFWQQRKGMRFELDLARYGRISLRIQDADQSSVYAICTDTDRKLFFSLADLELNEQLRIIGSSKPLQDFWTGSFLLRHGKPGQAAAAFQKVPAYGKTLVKLVNSGFELPKASDRDSVRSR